MSADRHSRARRGMLTVRGTGRASIPITPSRAITSTSKPPGTVRTKQFSAFYRFAFPAESFKRSKRDTTPLVVAVRAVLLESPAHPSFGEPASLCCRVYELGFHPLCLYSSGVVLYAVAFETTQHSSLSLHLSLIPANPAILRRRSSTTAVRQSAVRRSVAAAAIQSRGLSTWWSASAISQYGRGLSAAKRTVGGDVLSRRSR